MTDDRMNKIRELCEKYIVNGGFIEMNPRDVLALLDMIDRLREEIEASQERTVEELCGS